MLKFGGYGPKTGRTGAKHAKHPRAGPLDVVASFRKEFQGNLHSKHWLLLLRKPHFCSFLGSTLRSQSTKLLEVEANRGKNPVPAATTVVGKFQ